MSELVDDVRRENKMAPEKSLVFVQNSVNDTVFQRHGFTLWTQRLPARAESPDYDENYWIFRDRQRLKINSKHDHLLFRLVYENDISVTAIHIGI